MPWVADGLRDLGHRRTEMYRLFEQALTERGISYVVVSGFDYQERVVAVSREIDRLLSQHE